MCALHWRVRRAALGLRQRDVADKAGISQSRYSLLERGETDPRDEEARAIDQALQLPAEIDRALGEAEKPLTSQ
jgi:transcriptional regulator with XRE-family HTH domain